MQGRLKNQDLGHIHCQVSQNRILLVSEIEKTAVGEITNNVFHNNHYTDTTT